MRLKPFPRAALLIVATGITVAALWWKCVRDPAINFLPAHSGAEWIVFPAPMQAGAHRIATIDTVFRREFQLANSPARAELQLRAARRIELKINGKAVDVGSTGNWKNVASFGVGGLLQSGSNKIEARVFSDDAPAALWLRLLSDDFQLRSDRNWEASLAGSTWRHAALATAPTHPQPGNLLAGAETTFAVFPKIWPAWVGLATVAFLILVFGGRLIAAISKKSLLQAAALVGVAALAWTILFWNNGRLLPFHCGYDSTDHLAYIKYIQERRTLPLPNEGYEMFQPPLYYALSAAALSVGGLTVSDQGSVAVLRTLTMCFGIAHFVIVFLCLRLLSPTRPDGQLAGLLLAAFLPMQLYLSHYVTNETLAAALVSAAIYLALRILKKTRASIWEYAGLGLCVGAALLTKATTLLLIPPLIGALVLKMAHDKATLRFAISAGATTLIALFISCGWYYVWIWRHFGTPIVGNWERAFGFNWWQDPGFHTAAQYFRFGRSLSDPLFSGYNSFADGIYSTLWGDGLGGGLSDMLSRTPWTYDLMIGGYWLALIPTLIIAIGAAIAVREFVRAASPQWFLLLGFSAAVAVALTFMTFRVASYAQVKAFYGLSILVPLCAFAAHGWQKVERAPRFLRITFGSLMLVWALNSFFSVWIRDSMMQHIYAGRRLVREHRLDAAANEAEQAARRDPSSAMAACFLAAVLDDAGQTTNAVEHTERGLQIDSRDGYCRIQNAINVAKRGDIEQAMVIAQRLVEAEPENARAYNVWFTCARQLQQTDKAITIAQDALAIAPFDADLHYRLGLAAGEVGYFPIAVPQLAYALLLQPSRSDIEKKLHLGIIFAARSANAPDELAAIAAAAPDSPILLDELAWIFATDPNSTLRNGPEAVRLSERACALTKRERPKFLVTLAAAYAEIGRFSDGIAAGKEAASFARLAGDTSTSILAEKILSSLQGHQPYREEPTP
jgi:4-amino-4-deoxy-L-arabinose transferase-like glycosyltransferase